jgi:rod shape-determining protein MreD
VRRALTSAVLVFLAVVVQLTMIDRLPLPGGTTPDLVLLVVVALALSGGPMSGMITGFCAGLTLDIAPPSDHLMGAYALAFCLVGYGCGLVSAELDRSVLLPLAASAVGAAVGAALYAGVGILFGNPDVTGAAVRHVLPWSVIYDVIFSPFILYGVALANRLAARLAGSPVSPAELSGPALGGVQPAGGGSLGSRPTPRIRAGSSRPGDGWIGGGGWLAASAELARTRRATVRMHFGSGRAGSASQVRPSGAGGLASGKAAPKVKFGSGRRGDGVVGGGLLSGAGLLASLGLAGRGPAGRGLAGRGSPRLFTRRSRSASGALARFARRPAWGVRTAFGVGGSTPRKGTFNTGSGRKPVGSAATPRRGTFSASAPGRRTVSSGSPRRGAFSGGSSTKTSLGAGAPRRGAFSGPRRLRALRRRKSRLVRIVHKRNGGFR